LKAWQNMRGRKVELSILVEGVPRTIKVLDSNQNFCSRRCRYFIPVSLPEDPCDRPSQAECDLTDAKLQVDKKSFMRCWGCRTAWLTIRRTMSRRKNEI
jgi:hypothetical protein